MNYSQFEKVFVEDKKAFKLLRAIDEKSQMPENMRKAILIEMATMVSSKEDVISDLAKQFAFEHALERKDIKLLKDYLEKAETQNLAWNKLYKNTVTTAMKLNDKENLKKLLGFVDMKKFLTEQPGFQEQMALAYYQVDDFKTAWLLLRPSAGLSSGRAPASQDLVKTIRSELSRKFEGK